ncbi:MAG: metalloregulator ArsR/SmtB family transcription factor [Acidimicrobiia bacterium]|nr:metalloregulator ArsR/SmtB family transcription factor [Acidimicrobiia bacterium]
MKETLGRADAAEWASWFRAIGDPTRILVLHLLATERRPLTVGEITDRLDVGQSTVSHHLARLAAVGFVLVDRVGTASHWRVNEACIDAFPSAAEVVLGRVPSDFERARSCP